MTSRFTPLRINLIICKLTFLTFLFVPNNSDAKYKIEYSEKRHFQLVKFSGEFGPLSPLVALRKVAKKINGKKDILLLVGKSLGGVVWKFRYMIKILRQKCEISRGKRCVLTTIFTNKCGSACTFLPLYSDYSVSTPEAKFGYHTEWVINSRITIRSENEEARYYVNQGGGQWFLTNSYIFSENQRYGFYISKDEELESGLIDEHISSFREFSIQY